MTEKRSITFQDLMKVERISAPDIHPDGKFAAIVQSKHDSKENKTSSTIILLDLGTGKERDLTPGDHKDSNPKWSPDGSKLAFTSDRKDGSQIWVLPFSDGGEAYPVTEGEGGASQLRWASDNRRIAFARSVIVSPHFDGNMDGIPEKNSLPSGSELVNQIRSSNSCASMISSGLPEEITSPLSRIANRSQRTSASSMK